MYRSSYIAQLSVSNLCISTSIVFFTPWNWHNAGSVGMVQLALQVESMERSCTAPGWLCETSFLQFHQMDFPYPLISPCSTTIKHDKHIICWWSRCWVCCNPCQAWADTEGAIVRSCAAYCLDRFQRYAKSRLARICLRFHAWNQKWKPWHDLWYEALPMDCICCTDNTWQYSIEVLVIILSNPSDKQTSDHVTHAGSL